MKLGVGGEVPDYILRFRQFLELNLHSAAINRTLDQIEFYADEIDVESSFDLVSKCGKNMYITLNQGGSERFPKIENRAKTQNRRYKTLYRLYKPVMG